MRHPLHASRAHGFTIVELMVALIIIAIGLLGVARMQALALSGAGVSRLRSLAALEAASLASAMHANRAYWAAATLTQPIKVSGAVVTTSASDLASNLITVNNARTSYCTTDHGAPCSPVTLAAADLQEWATDLNLTLAHATADITCPPTNTPVSCTIRVNWLENAVAINPQQAAAAEASTDPAQFQLPTYTLYVEP